MALKEYAELQAQAAELDPAELYNARQELRPDKERDAVARIQKAYGEKYNPQLMAESKREVSSMLNEYGEERSIRERNRQAEIEDWRRQKEQQQKKKKNKIWNGKTHRGIADMKADFLDTLEKSEEISAKRAELQLWERLPAELMKVFTPLL